MVQGPGMGKTTMASKFASRSDLPGYTHVLWISMMDEQFIESISKTCTQLGLSAKSDADKQQAVFNCLNTSTRYLLILDSADDAEFVKKCFEGVSKFGGHVIITSRNAAIAEHVTLGMMDSDILHQEMLFWTRETVEGYVSSRLKHRFRSISDDEKKSYNKILEYTEGYPLAIEQICGYLATQRSVTFSAFLDILESGEVWKLNSATGANHYQRTLHVVVENALRTLRNKNEEAYVLLATIANVSNKDIPIETYLARFLQNAGFTTNIRVALTPIVDMSLITFDPQDNFVSIHRAIQDEIRRILPSSSDTLAINYIELTVKSLTELLPTAVHESYKPGALNDWNPLFPLVVEVTKTSTEKTKSLAELCYKAADLARFFCLFGYARTLNESAIEIYTQVNGSRIDDDVACATLV
ncbi:hypothetical protein HK098_003472 [Nowakowskiella sp. JEL0407]|nr:hypothetical protein HK098_003472 [Nowakowskiella sp. JEL0407]